MEQQPYTYQPSPPTNGLAIASLIASILGLVNFLPIIGSIAGLIMGYMAKKQIEESMGASGGEGIAKWGIILGWVGIGLSLLIICAVVAIFALGFGTTACAVMGNTY